MIPHAVKYLTLLALVISASWLSAATLEVGSGRTYTTIQSCLNAAQAGDTCNVHAGTYPEQISLPRSGASGKLITLQANADDTVNVQSGSSPVVNISGKSYWTIDGINFTYNGGGSSPRVVSSSGSVDFGTLSNNKLTLASGSGDGFVINMPNTDHLSITGNTIVVSASTGAHDGADLLMASNLKFSGNTMYGNASESTGKLEDGLVVSGTNLNIENNVMHDGWSYDTHPDGIVIQGDGDRNGNDTANVKVWRNTLYNFSQLVYFDAIHAPLGGANLIADNLLYENGYRYGGQSNKVNCIVLDGENLSGSSGYAVNAKVYNNTVGCGQLDVYVLRTGSGTSIDFKNNLYVDPPYTAIMISSTNGVTMDYDYFSQSDNSPLKWGSSVLSLSGMKSIVEAHGISGNANLNANYTPTATSDSQNRGVNLFSFLTVDKAGTPLPSSGAWDIGAYQSAGTTASTPPEPPQNLQVTVH